jgi:hypothetical protein
MGPKCTSFPNCFAGSQDPDQFTGKSFFAVVADSLSAGNSNYAINIDYAAITELGFIEYDNREVTW